jgi:hypothetical protein
LLGKEGPRIAANPALRNTLYRGICRNGPHPMDQPRPISPIWACLAAPLLVLLALGGIMLAPYLSPPAPGHVTGILFAPGTQAGTALADILAADPTAQIVDMRLGGSLVFAVYHQPGFPAAIARLGARASFDAIAAGCHGTGPATQLTRLGP